MIPQSQGLARRPLRTVFVSDIHLGCKHSQAAAFLRFLDSIEPHQLYLVGDFIDGWKLRRQWRWNSIYSRILLRLCEMAHGGTRIFFTPGNHDDFLREPMIREVVSMGLVRIRDEFVHHMADGRRFLVLHGDRFDKVETGARWMSIVASIAYDSLLAANSLACHIRRQAVSKKYSLGAAVKQQVKRVVNFISDFERRLVEHAAEQCCAGIVCGHIHTPTIAQRDDILYCNTGDWVENCTALIEDQSGRLELVECRDDDDWHSLAVAPSSVPLVGRHRTTSVNGSEAADPLTLSTDDLLLEKAGTRISNTSAIHWFSEDGQTVAQADDSEIVTHYKPTPHNDRHDEWTCSATMAD